MEGGGTLEKQKAFQWVKGGHRDDPETLKKIKVPEVLFSWRLKTAKQNSQNFQTCALLSKTRRQLLCFNKNTKQKTIEFIHFDDVNQSNVDLSAPVLCLHRIISRLVAANNQPGGQRGCCEAQVTRRSPTCARERGVCVCVPSSLSLPWWSWIDFIDYRRENQEDL